MAANLLRTSAQHLMVTHLAACSRPVVFQVMATAHGYAALTAAGLTPLTMPLTVDEAVSHTADAVRALIAGASHPPRRPRDEGDLSLYTS